MKYEHTDDATLMARLDGTLPPEAAAAFDARRAMDPALDRAFTAMASLSCDLETLGDLAAVDTPEINIVEAVLHASQDIASGARPVPTDGFPEDEALIACLEGAGDAAFAQRLADDSDLQEELDATRAIWQDLERLGSAYREEAPGIDIQDAVLERIGDAATEQVADDLHRLGDLATAHNGTIDIVDEVMAAVAEAKARPENVVPFRTRPKPHLSKLETGSDSFPWGRSLAAAAAAILIFSLGYVSRDLAVPTPTPVATNMDADADSKEVLPKLNPKEFHASLPRDVRSRYHDDRLLSRERPATRVETASETVETPQRVEFAKRPGTVDVFNARRAAMMKDAEALASLADWATLSPEEALQILKDLGYTPDAILAAVPFLSSEDAIGLLQGAVGKDPSNPLLRAALAENLMESGNLDEGHLQLAEWSKTDKENGLPAYYEAQLLFQEGNIAGGLAALDNAAAYGAVNTYSRERAQSHEAALRAAGMDPESAAMLAGVAANDGEYARLGELGASLLEQGKALAAAGDFEGAARSYEAALQLGEQVQGQAHFMNEAAAALVLQEDAYNALNELSRITAMSEEMLDFLGQTNREIVEGFQLLNTLYQSMYDLYANGDPSGVADYISGLISGDLPLFFGL